MHPGARPTERDASAEVHFQRAVRRLSMSFFISASSTLDSREAPFLPLKPATCLFDLLVEPVTDRFGLPAVLLDRSFNPSKSRRAWPHDPRDDTIAL